MTTYLQQAQTGVWDVQASFLPAIYLQGVNLAGGTVVLCRRSSPTSPTGARRSGRADHHRRPRRRPGPLRQDRGPSTDEPATDRDAWEFALVEQALQRRLPLLGICRGAQVLNVVRGGTLHQHLPDVLGHNRHQLGNAVFSTSTVDIVAGTRLAALIGASTDAQCYHHQGIDRLGDGLVISARDHEDAAVEAIGSIRDSTPTSSPSRCSGTPRNASTICACSAPWSMRPAAIRQPVSTSQKGFHDQL
jgi:putative glutamine amidotransferase